MIKAKGGFGVGMYSCVSLIECKEEKSTTTSAERLSSPELSKYNLGLTYRQVIENTASLSYLRRYHTADAFRQRRALESSTDICSRWRKVEKGGERGYTKQNWKMLPEVMASIEISDMVLSLPDQKRKTTEQERFLSCCFMHIHFPRLKTYWTTSSRLTTFRPLGGKGTNRDRGHQRIRRLCTTSEDP